MTSVPELQRELRQCQRCLTDGTLSAVAPVVAGPAGARFLLVGQAPGPVEINTRLPFSGRAGRELARWMIRAGFKDEADFRARIYLSAMARCFPGRNAADSGDLPPSRAQRRNCLPWLAAELELLRPKVVITVGKMATDHFLGPGPLGDRVGQLYSANPSVLPLPHPSGQNRWLNVQENRDRLALALNLLSELRVFVR